MKPLIVSGLYLPHQMGGAEKVARIVAEGMLLHGHQPVVVTTQEGSADRVDHVGGVKVHYLGLKNLYWPWSLKERPGLLRALWHGIDRHNGFMARAVGRILDLEKPDIVNTHQLTGLSSAVWSEVKSRKLPLVHTLHDYSLMCPKSSMFKAGQNCPRQCRACKLYTSPSKRLSAKVDHVVGVSRFTLERHLASGYFQAVRQTHVIHNGLPGHPSAAHRHDRPAGSPLRLGYVGRLTSPKGIRELVHQMGEWQFGQCELLVAGKGAAAYEALLRAEAPKNVRFLGFVDPEEVYRAIDLLIVPSLWEEAFGLIVVEAYMHGVPVIVSRRGGLPELVDEGRTGIVYEPLEPGSLRQAVDAFLCKPLMFQDMRPFVLEKARDFLQGRMQMKYLRLLSEAKEAVAIKEQPRQHGGSPV